MSKNYMYNDDFNPYIALDGTDQYDLDSLNAANEEFWKKILKHEELQSSERLRDIYKSIIDILWSNVIDFPMWNGFYNILITGLPMNIYSDAFMRVFANALLSAQVKCLEIKQDEELQKKRGKLSAIVDQLRTQNR